MSTGESDYAKRVVELSMQLANSRADVENLRMRIKAVDKEHEQLKKDRADMADRIDAALRRAKAEGLEQVSELKKALELYRDASYQGHSSHWDKTGGSGSGCPACLRAIELRAQARQIVDTLDARAAQIEANEQEGT